MTADDACEIIITAPDADWLADLCHQLVDARLAASAHIVHPVTSITDGTEPSRQPPRRAPSCARAARYSSNSSLAWLSAETAGGQQSAI